MKSIKINEDVKTLFRSIGENIPIYFLTDYIRILYINDLCDVLIILCIVGRNNIS
jgi:hypothetical protein